MVAHRNRHWASWALRNPVWNPPPILAASGMTLLTFVVVIYYLHNYSVKSLRAWTMAFSSVFPLHGVALSAAQIQLCNIGYWGTWSNMTQPDADLWNARAERMRVCLLPRLTWSTSLSGERMRPSVHYVTDIWTFLMPWTGLYFLTGTEFCVSPIFLEIAF